MQNAECRMQNAECRVQSAEWGSRRPRDHGQRTTGEGSVGHSSSRWYLFKTAFTSRRRSDWRKASYAPSWGQLRRSRFARSKIKRSSKSQIPSSKQAPKPKSQAPGPRAMALRCRGVSVGSENANFTGRDVRASLRWLALPKEDQIAKMIHTCRRVARTESVQFYPDF